MGVSLNKTHFIILQASNSYSNSIRLNIKLNIDILMLTLGLALNSTVLLAG